MRELLGLLGFGPCPALFDAEVSVMVHSPAASAAATWVWAGAGRIGTLTTPGATCRAYCQWCGLAGHRYRGRARLLGRLRAADSADSPAGSSSLPAAVEVLSTIHPAGPTRPPKAPRSAGCTPTCSARAGHGPRGSSIRTSRLATHTRRGLSSANKSLTHLHGLTTVSHPIPGPSVVHRHTVFCHRGARMNLMASTDPVTPNQHPQHNTQEN